MKEYIEREAAIRLANNHKDKMIDANDIARIPAADVRPVVQEWVSVYDCLPQQGERVLATDGVFVEELYINKWGQWQRYNVNYHSLLKALDILWWMPMPEPPKDMRKCKECPYEKF